MKTWLSSLVNMFWLAFLSIIVYPPSLDASAAWEEEKRPVDRFTMRLKNGYAKTYERKVAVKESSQDSLAVIAIFNGHDSSIAVSIDGRVQCVLELERLFEIRYYMSEDRDEMLRALKVIKSKCECEVECPHHFDVGITVSGAHGTKQVRKIVEEVFSVKRWKQVHHHRAHALLGFHSSPFQSALVISYDGGSPDGSFHAYVGSGQEVRHLAKLDYNMGFAYNCLASLIHEVTGNSIHGLCSDVQKGIRRGNAYRRLAPTEQPDGRELSWAGKLMGYAAIGQVRSDIRNMVRTYFENGFSVDFRSDYEEMENRVPEKLINMICESAEPLEMQRALAASMQVEFQTMAFQIVEELFDHIRDEHVEGIVLTGGCALNVLANQMIYEELLLVKSNDSSVSLNGSLPKIFVPPAPNDGGLTVGALWDVQVPKERQQLQYLGFNVWDVGELDAIASMRSAVRLSELGGVDYLARLLAGEGLDASCNRTKAIVAVVRGRQEFGPRALGHRSLLAVPDSINMRDRMNRIKFRQWYRPVAPMMVDEALSEVFGSEIKSPYMTMAPQVLEGIKDRFPALAHMDGTARHQSVGKEDEPWLHDLLLAVGKLTGLAALINTSFNTRGKPIVNTVRDSLKMMDELTDLNYVLIEDWLFSSMGDSCTSTLRPQQNKLRNQQEL